jgi:hypothetical protein
MINKDYLQDMIRIIDRKLTNETDLKVIKVFTEALFAMRAELKDIQKDFPDSF